MEEEVKLERRVKSQEWEKIIILTLKSHAQIAIEATKAIEMEEEKVKEVLC